MFAILPVTAAPLWQDEFNQPDGSAPDSRKWTYDLGANGWGNAELEDYTASRENSFITSDPDATDGKALVIRAVRDAAGRYTSARLKTQGIYSVTYGRIEARMKLPEGQGIWPAFWMLGANITKVGWPKCGEIDIMEAPGHEPHKLHGTLHGPGYSGNKGHDLARPEIPQRRLPCVRRGLVAGTDRVVAGRRRLSRGHPRILARRGSVGLRRRALFPAAEPGGGRSLARLPRRHYALSPGAPRGLRARAGVIEAVAGALS
jgi:hypothetical protein